MASFVGKTGSSRQTRAILHTVSYLLNIRSNYRSATKNKIILEFMWCILRSEKYSILQLALILERLKVRVNSLLMNYSYFVSFKA